jgi:hypothetical protein
VQEIYKEASDFALQMVIDPDLNFAKILVENLGNDEQDKLIVLDYLIIDYVIEHYKLSSL